MFISTPSQNPIKVTENSKVKTHKDKENLRW